MQIINTRNRVVAIVFLMLNIDRCQNVITESAKIDSLHTDSIPSTHHPNQVCDDS